MNLTGYAVVGMLVALSLAGCSGKEIVKQTAYTITTCRSEYYAKPGSDFRTAEHHCSKVGQHAMANASGSCLGGNMTVWKCAP